MTTTKYIWGIVIIVVVILVGYFVWKYHAKAGNVFSPSVVTTSTTSTNTGLAK